MTSTIAQDAGLCHDVLGIPAYRRHFAESSHVSATTSALFDFLDDHRRLSDHMARPSWMMLGGAMRVAFDAMGGRGLGAKIQLRGAVLGMRLDVEEVVTEYTPGHSKVWQTVGSPRLLIIGAYRMGFTATPRGEGAQATVFIDYDPPSRPLQRILSGLLGGIYARWCVRRMLADAARQFNAAKPGPRA